MARHFGKLAVALAALFIGGQALAHGHHSHGKPLTEVEKKAEAGVFDDKDVKDRDRGLGGRVAIRVSLSAQWGARSGVQEEGGAG